MSSSFTHGTSSGVKLQQTDCALLFSRGFSSDTKELSTVALLQWNWGLSCINREPCPIWPTETWGWPRKFIMRTQVFVRWCECSGFYWLKRNNYNYYILQTTPLHFTSRGGFAASVEPEDTESKCFVLKASTVTGSALTLAKGQRSATRETNDERVKLIRGEAFNPDLTKLIHPPWKRVNFCL